MEKWKWDENNLAYKGARVAVHKLELKSENGSVTPRDTVVVADAAVIVPVLDDGQVVLIRNERFAINKTIWELPAGTLEPGENPKPAAAREVEEETGYQAGNIKFLCSFYTTPGFCTENMHAYLATDLKHKGQNLDDSERITVHSKPIDEALKMIQTGGITDAKTIAALLFAVRFGDI